MPLSKTSNQDLAKEAAAKKAAADIQNGMIVGLGTGTTAKKFIEHLSLRVEKGLNIQATASSKESAELAKKLKIPLFDINDLTHLDVTVDGADEIDLDHQMIKGGGGALLREKILAKNSREVWIVVDSSKKVNKLGSVPLPIEIVSFGYLFTKKQIEKLQLHATLRFTKEQKPFTTDNGNWILDIAPHASFQKPEILDQQLKNIPGVVETGLFYHLPVKMILGHLDQKVEVL